MTIRALFGFALLGLVAGCEKPAAPAASHPSKNAGEPADPRFFIGIVQSNDGWLYSSGTTQTAAADRIVPTWPKDADHTVIIEGPGAAPWLVVESLMEALARKGVSDIGWWVDGKTTPATLPKDAPLRVLENPNLTLEEIRVFIDVDRTSGAVRRRVGNREWAPNDRELMQAVRSMASDYDRAGKTEVPIIVDALNTVPWSGVFDFVKLCREANLVGVRFVAPIRSVDFIDRRKIPKDKNDPVTIDEPAIFFPEVRESPAPKK